MGGDTDHSKEPTRLPSLLVVGLLTNALLLHRSLAPELHGMEPAVLLTAQIFIAVSAFRCTFPNRYNGNIVLHDTWLSSIFLTRAIATCSELAWIYQLSYVARQFNKVGDSPAPWLDAAAWAMVAFSSVAQCFVWAAITLGRDYLMFYEECCWAGIFVCNTAANAHLYLSGIGGAQGVATVSLVFAVFYLPWQLGLHIPSLDVPAPTPPAGGAIAWGQEFSRGLSCALHTRKPSRLAVDWGGAVGAVWMTAYWIILPYWLLYTAEQYQLTFHGGH